VGSVEVGKGDGVSAGVSLGTAVGDADSVGKLGVLSTTVGLGVAGLAVQDVRTSAKTRMAIKPLWPHPDLSDNPDTSVILELHFFIFDSENAFTMHYVSIDAPFNCIACCLHRSV
jgi:hypothetical protein